MTNELQISAKQMSSFLSSQQIAQLNLNRCLSNPSKQATNSQVFAWAQNEHLQQSQSSLPAPRVITPSQYNQPLPEQNLQQRVNYCTICNKELCNKYFMKTHMLKMHGINLQVEATSAPASASITSDGNKEFTTFNGQTQDRAAAKGKRKFELSNEGKLKFAGISLGGVVCDICNKELCSKYFLKVHKQNTHGVDTEFNDLGRQLAFPLAPNDPRQQVQSTTRSNQMNPRSSLGFYPFALSTSAYLQPAEGPAKRIRLEPHGQFNSQQVAGMEEHCCSQAFEAIHKRILLAQRYNPMLSSTFCNNSAPSMCQSAREDDSLGPLLYLLSSQAIKNPFGSSGHVAQNLGTINSNTSALSPALMVELILRNQHLVENRSGEPAACNFNKPVRIQTLSQQRGIDVNPCKSMASKTPNHYTEACPMCERKFKSIKWLKTHMLNDHKDEIRLQSQALLQRHIVSNKNQQVNGLGSQVYPSLFVTNPINAPEIKQNQMHAFMQLQSILQQSQQQASLQQKSIIMNFKQQQQQLNPVAESNINPVATDLSCNSTTKSFTVEASENHPHSSGD